MMEAKHNESRTDYNSCNGLTLLERKISTSTSALETEIIFNLLTWSHTFLEFDHELISQ